MKRKIDVTRYKIIFKRDPILSIQLKTPSLTIQSITSADKENCIALFSDPIVMKKFGTGMTYDINTTHAKLKSWEHCWKNHDPFSVYAIFEGNTTQIFIGIISIESFSSQEAEIAYALHHRFWGKGYGSEAADSLCQVLIPRLILRGYKPNHQTLRKIVATARLDNRASQKILQGVGLKERSIVYKCGAMRYFFELSAKQLKNEYHHFFQRKDRQLYQQTRARIINEDVDISAKEMAASAFGHR